MRNLRLPLLIAVMLLQLDGLAVAQGVFTSGSTGADGPYVVYAPPRGVRQHALAYDAARQVVVSFGGYDITGTIGNDHWEWDGVRWTERQFATLPAPRYDVAMAYDTKRNVLVLFGGYGTAGNTLLGDTWEFDGTTWTQKSPSVAPSARHDHAMAYDAARERVVLLGGQTTGGVSEETWLWNGTSWTKGADFPGTNYSYTHQMAYDGDRQLVVTQAYNGDTWEWDGTAWTKRLVDTPGSHQDYCLAYDSVRKKTVLFGGYHGGYANDTWLWDGVAWTQVFPTDAPSGRQYPGCVFDTARGQLVLFGGYGPGSSAWDDTWVWNGTTWTTPSTTGPLATLDMRSKPNGTWNFTTIEIQAGSTIQFANPLANVPVVLLATGAVKIAGEIDVDGQDGNNNPNPGSEANGGPGGFRGGRGGIMKVVTGSYSGTPGEGPGGGLPGTTSNQFGGGGGYGTAGTTYSTGAAGGASYGNRLLQPLLGGSGGGGAASTDNANGGNAAGGGGAILIASSQDIRFDGSIHANGGRGNGFGGGGSGGGIRLVANRISGGGFLQAIGGGSYGDGGVGRIRTEAFYVQLTRLPNPPNAAAPPLGIGVAGSTGTIRVTEVGGQPVPNPPAGDTNAPDVVFSQAGNTTVKMATTGIPQGTKLTVRVVASGEVVTGQSGGVDASGNATASLRVPAGVGTVQAFAEYVPPPPGP